MIRLPPFLIAAIIAATIPAISDARRGEIITGQASVVDGDTIDIHGERIRLHGIDAPERSQRCTDAGGIEFRCGAAVAEALRTHIAGQTVSCQVMDVDQYGRSVGRCDAPAARSGGISGTLNRALAQAGYVYAMPRYARDYVGDVDRARAARAGLFAGRFEDPSEFRRRQRQR